MKQSATMTSLLKHTLNKLGKIFLPFSCHFLSESWCVLPLPSLNVLLCWNSSQGLQIFFHTTGIFCVTTALGAERSFFPYLVMIVDKFSSPLLVISHGVIVGLIPIYDLPMSPHIEVFHAPNVVSWVGTRTSVGWGQDCLLIWTCTILLPLS